MHNRCEDRSCGDWRRHNVHRRIIGVKVTVGGAKKAFYAQAYIPRIRDVTETADIEEPTESTGYLPGLSGYNLANVLSLGVWVKRRNRITAKCNLVSDRHGILLRV